MHKNLLDIVESEASEDGETSVKPDVLSESECADSGGGEDHWGEATDGDESYTCEERSTEVKILFLLSSGSNESDRSHHSDGVETGAGDQSWRCHEQKRGEKGTLSGVECSPEAIFRKIVVGVCSARCHHGTN